MTMLPQSNARLVSVSRGGFTEDYDRPAGDPVPVWTGNLDAYIQRKQRSVFGGTDLNRVLDVTLIVSGDIAKQLVGGLKTGDLVNYIAGDPASPTPMSARIQNVVNPAFLAFLPDYYKCALEEIEAP